jgi:hypothetical protein
MLLWQQFSKQSITVFGKVEIERCGRIDRVLQKA